MTEKIRLTPEEAIACLPDGDLIHTFYSSGFMIVGVDWSRHATPDKGPSVKHREPCPVCNQE